MHAKFLTTTIISLSYCCEKFFCPYDYLDDWEKFNEISLSEKEDFYSDLNMEDITDADYTNDSRYQKKPDKSCF